MSNRLSLIALSRILRVEATSVRIDKRNLLEARVIVTTTNDHVRLLSPEPWLVSATKVYSGVGADIVMESSHSLTPFPDPRPATSQLHRDLYPAHPRSAAPAPVGRSLRRSQVRDEVSQRLEALLDSLIGRH